MLLQEFTSNWYHVFLFLNRLKSLVCDFLTSLGEGGGGGGVYAEWEKGFTKHNVSFARESLEGAEFKWQLSPM